MATGMKHASFRPYGEALSKPIGRIGLLFMLACCSASTGCRRPDRPSSVSERLQERKWIVQFPGPKDYSCEMRFTATERIVTLVYMGRHENRSDYRLFDEPAAGPFRHRREIGRELKRTLHRDADPRPRRSGPTRISEEFRNFRHLGTVRFPADSGGQRKPMPQPSSGENGRSSQKAATGPEHGLRTGEPDDGAESRRQPARCPEKNLDDLPD